MNTLHQKNGRWWVGMPGRPYAGADGHIIDFRDRTTRDRSQSYALDAALVVYRTQREAS
jgi:hypothetical protein